LQFLHLGHAAAITDASIVHLARTCNRLRYVDLACAFPFTLLLDSNFLSRLYLTDQRIRPGTLCTTKAAPNRSCSRHELDGSGSRIPHSTTQHPRARPPLVLRTGYCQGYPFPSPKAR
jgi:hypothetical protein